MRISDWSSDVCSSDLGDVLCGSGTFDPPTTKLDANGQGSPYATYGFAAQIAEVAVDLDLGTVKVLRMAAAHDVGRAVNPTLVEGQIHGGIAQGLGLALMEEYLPGRTEKLHDSAEERRVGKECVRTGRSRWWTGKLKKKKREK